MKRNWPLKVVTILPLVILAFTVFTFAVMKLWNWLMPALFGWHEITVWQALGILVLSKILFGGFRGGPPWRHRMMERWAQMTPEEREKFRAGMRGRCAPWGAPASDTKAEDKV